jgi:hypothetical protein
LPEKRRSITDSVPQKDNLDQVEEVIQDESYEQLRVNLFGDDYLQELLHSNREIELKCDGLMHSLQTSYLEQTLLIRSIYSNFNH